MVPVLVGLPLELLLDLHTVLQAHDVGDEEGLGAGLGPGDVSRGGGDGHSSALHAGGKRWRQGETAIKLESERDKKVSTFRPATSSTKIWARSVR